MIDYVDINLRPAFGAIRDQGPRPTCLAHAVSAAHERVRGTGITLSPEYLHFFSTGGRPSSGASMTQAANALRTKGQPEEAHCPYLGASPASAWKPHTGVPVFRRASEIKAAGITEIREAIRTGNTPIIGVSVPQSFYIVGPPWVISSHGPIRGLHAVTAVGYGRHSGDHLVLIRNSWGETWGDSGYAWLDDGFLTRHLKDMLVLTDDVAS